MLFFYFRTIVFRRIALMLSLLYGYRAITMMITVLPKANPAYYCSPKVISKGGALTFGTVLFRVTQLLSGRLLGLLTIGEQGGWLRGGYPLLKKKFMTPPLKLKMTPTPSEIAFDPLPRF